MFRFETLVKCVLIYIGLSASTAFAATNNNNNSNGTDCTRLDELYGKAVSDGNDKLAQYYSDKSTICYANQSKTGGDCDNKSEAFNKNLGDFGTACGDANMGGDCAVEVSKCNLTSKTDRDSGDRDRGSRDPNQPYDVNGVKRQCPALAGRDMDKLRDEIKDQKKKVKDLQDELPKIEEDANSKQSKLNDKLAELKQELADKQKKMGEDMQKISEDKEGAEKAIIDQVTAITGQIAKARDAISQVSVSKLQGQLAMKSTKNKIELNCHAAATAQVNKMQNDVIDGIKSGTFNGGGFASLMKNVGMSDRQRWQKLAMKYYQWCLDSKPTKDSKDEANDGYRLLVVQADKSEASIREQIRQLQAQQNQLSNPQACQQMMATQANGSGGNETALCQAARKATQRAQQIQQNFLTDQQTARDKYQQLAQQGQQEITTLRNKYMQKQQEASEEKSRLDNLQRYFEAKNDRSGGVSTDGKGLGKALGLATQAAASAKVLISCQKRYAQSHNQTFQCDGDCDAAKTFLKSYYGSDDFYESAINNSDQITVGPNAPAITHDVDQQPDGQPKQTPPTTGPAKTGH